MTVSGHFQRSGHIHGIWAICVLLAIIAGLMLRVPNGDKVADYISFASSIASLVLALVAIFYSIISNQSIAENLGSLDQTTGRLDKASDQIESITQTIEDNFLKIFDEFQEITPEMKRISDRVDKALEPRAEKGSNQTTKTGSADIGISTFERFNITLGSHAAWYVISKSIKTGKSIKIEEIFGKDTPFDYYISGYMTALIVMQDEVNINREISETKPIYYVSSDKLNTEFIISSYSDDNAMKIAIDSYFEDIDQ